MHLKVDSTIAEMAGRTQRPNLPKGTSVGTTKTLKTNGMGPHCHLMWVKGERWYNALSILDPWSDLSPPEFLRRPPLVADTTHPQNIPPVRIVPDFDPRDTAHPIAFFPTLFDPTTNTSISVVQGDCRVLARTKDALRSDRNLVPPGGSIAGSENTVPAAVDLEFTQVGGPGATRAPLVPFAYDPLNFTSSAQIDFQLPILLGPKSEDATSPGSRRRDPGPRRGSTWFHRRASHERERTLSGLRVSALVLCTPGQQLEPAALHRSGVELPSSED